MLLRNVIKEAIWYTPPWGDNSASQTADTVTQPDAMKKIPDKRPVKMAENNTGGEGASVWNFLLPGLSAVGSYALNRGDLSESDSYYVSVSKDFGPFSLNASYSNTFKGLRFDPVTGEPLPISIADYQNVSVGTLIRVSRTVSAQVEYGGFLQTGMNEHFLFVRLIYRTR